MNKTTEKSIEIAIPNQEDWKKALALAIITVPGVYQNGEERDEETIHVSIAYQKLEQLLHFFFLTGQYSKGESHDVFVGGTKVAFSTMGATQYLDAQAV